LQHLLALDLRPGYVVYRAGGHLDASQVCDGSLGHTAEADPACVEISSSGAEPLQPGAVKTGQENTRGVLFQGAGKSAAPLVLGPHPLRVGIRHKDEDGPGPGAVDLIKIFEQFPAPYGGHAVGVAEDSQARHPELVHHLFRELVIVTREGDCYIEVVDIAI
jgi:hypothetical protein